MDAKVQQGLDLGRQLQENAIENYPKLIREFLAKNFNQRTLNCFFGSNDLRRLILSYNIQSLDNAVQAFANYSYQKFTDMHDTFLNLIQLIKIKDSQ